MQGEKSRTSNRDRSEVMRSKLIAAARDLFAQQGFAETGTHEIVTAASVTRGALYHHFADKQMLFQAVIEQEAAQVAAEIEQAAEPQQESFDALLAGSAAYLDAMQTSGRTRLLLLDGPAVLGRDEMDRIDATHAARTLREGLDAAMAEGTLRRLPTDVLTSLLSAMFDRAALAIELGADPATCLEVIEAMLTGLRAR